MADDFKSLRGLAVHLASQKAPAQKHKQPDMWLVSEFEERRATIAESLLTDLALSRDVRKQKLFVEIAWGLPTNKITGEDGQEKMTRIIVENSLPQDI